MSELDKVEVDANPGQLKRMLERSSRRSAPQIFIGEAHVGGFDELAALERDGQLDSLLGSPRPSA